MPPQTSRRRSRRELEDDEDEDVTRYSVDSPQDQDGPKRRRKAATGDNSSDDDDSGQEAPSDVRPPNNTLGANERPDDPDGDGFQPGAIRRVKLENFVTYKKAEFFPGPSLNMVLGPNGTGKSSLVCAICLGLGYNPKLMGRATSVKDFVKNGTSTATIEIELQRRRQDRAHHVVRVQIDRDRNSQKWWLNNRDTTHKAIQKLMRELNIQIDNLCQFLPQDRVVEFAGLTPIELLHETLRAAAPAKMLEWQTQLQDLHKDQKELQAQTGNHTETLANLENRQQAMQADVDRLREREVVQKRIGDLRDARVIVAYRELRTKHKDTRDKLRAAKHRFRELEEEAEPSLLAVNKKQEYLEAVTAVVQGRKTAVRSAEQAADRLLNGVENADEEVNQSQVKIESERKAFQVKKQEISKVVKKIGALENRLKNKPDDFDPHEHNRKIRARENEKRDLASEYRNIDAKFQDIKERGITSKQEKERLKRELDELDTQAGQQLRLIPRSHADVVKGWKWLQENGSDMFEKEVFGPPLLTCNVKDKRYSDQVQALLQQDDFMCFTTQTREDHKKLGDIFFGELGLFVSIRTCLKPFSSFQPPPREEAARLGFDAFAVDMLNGPEPILAMLCSEKKLHLAGVALRDVDEGQYHRLSEHESIMTWATGRRFYRVTRRRELGPSAVSTMTRDIQEGRWWKDETDASAKQDLEKRLEEATKTFDDLKQEHAQVKKDMEENLEQQNAKKSAKADLEEQKAVLQKENTEFKALPGKLANEKASQEKKREELEESRATQVELNVAFDKAIIHKARAVIKHQQSIAAIREAQEAVIEAQIREIEAQSDYTGLQERNTANLRRLDEEKRKIAELERAKDQLTQRAQDAQNQVVQTCNSHEQGKDYLEEVAGQRTTEEIDEDVQAEEAKLELIHAANPNVIRDFEKRAREIDKLREKMETAQSKTDQLARQISRIRERWEPKLDDLVSNINDAFAYNFEQISCAGEVRVHKAEDFEQWALDIRVKFRENETLQQLDQQRQSGGERAVSTVFFLMALQSMAQAPFRVVDEINQGMDPRNERMVHSRMVEIACNEHTSQYFLITPKLLPGLTYHERMRVLCIASGEHMPSEGRKLDFQRCLRVHKRSIGSVA